jgi:hypothetical protein
VPVCHSAVYTGDLKVPVLCITAADTAPQPHTTCISPFFSMLYSKMTVMEGKANSGYVRGLGKANSGHVHGRGKANSGHVCGRGKANSGNVRGLGSQVKPCP